jgi:hypothetical protein
VLADETIKIFIFYLIDPIKDNKELDSFEDFRSNKIKKVQSAKSLNLVLLSAARMLEASQDHMTGVARLFCSRANFQKDK